MVTGASSGIGAALARQLGKRGERVVLGARREDLLRKVAAESGPDALALVTDVIKRAEVERLRDEAIRKFGLVESYFRDVGAFEESLAKRRQGTEGADQVRTRPS